MGKVFHSNRYTPTFYSIISFYIRRYLRIAPLLYFNLLVCSALFSYANLDYRMLLGDLFFVTNFTGRGINLVTWSLSPEMQYYLIAPLVFFLLRRMNILTLAASIAVCYLVYTVTRSGWLAHFQFMYAFLAGYSVNIVLRLMPVRMNEKSKIVLIFAGMVTLNSLFNWLTISPYANWSGQMAVIVSALLVWVAECPCSFEVTSRNAFAARIAAFCVFTGELSFGLYLWHYVIVRTRSDQFAALTDYFAPYFNATQALGKSLLFHAIQVSLVLAWSYALASICFQLIERRFRPDLYVREVGPSIPRGAAGDLDNEPSGSKVESVLPYDFARTILMTTNGPIRWASRGIHSMRISPLSSFGKSGVRGILTVLAIVGLTLLGNHVAQLWISGTESLPRVPPHPAATAVDAIPAVSPGAVHGDSIVPETVLASSNETYMSRLAFDGDLGTWWQSKERGLAVKGKAWLGAGFSPPLRPTDVIIHQNPVGQRFTESALSLEASDDATTWRIVPTRAIQVTPTTLRLDVDNAGPAPYWRVMAAGDDTIDNANWSVSELEFRGSVVADARRQPPLQGTPLAARLLHLPALSGFAPIKPEMAPAFDGNPTTSWVSPEHGHAIKGRSWIGFYFPTATNVAAIRLLQTWNPPYHQNWVNVQQSDDGTTWHSVGRGPIRSSDDLSLLVLAKAPPARFWRIVAASDENVTDDSTWAVVEVTPLRAAGDITGAN